MTTFVQKNISKIQLLYSYVVVGDFLTLEHDKDLIKRIEEFGTDNLRTAFVDSLYSTLRNVVLPTPLFYIPKKDDSFIIQFSNTDFNGFEEVSALDVSIAALFSNANLLFEGETGTGKTYIAKSLFETIFGNEGYYSLRLNSGMLSTSVFEPFTKVVLDNGVPKVVVNEEKLSSYGAIFVDEVNRGDTNELLQLLDGVIVLNGETYNLKLPIAGSDDYKKIVVFGAVNPDSGEYTGVSSLDAAVEGRFLKLFFRNGLEFLSSQLDVEPSDLHASFSEIFKEKTSIEYDWKTIYPLISSSNTVFDSYSKEVLDVFSAFLNNPVESFEKNLSILEVLGVSPAFSLNEDNDFELLVSKLSFKTPFSRRDVNSVYQWSKILDFIGAFKSTNYLHGVVPSSLSLVLSNKISDKDSAPSAVEEIYKSYKSILDSFNVPLGFSFRNIVLESALKYSKNRGYAGFVYVLDETLNHLNKETSSAIDSVVLSRIMSDVALLKYFAENHNQQLESLFKNNNIRENFVSFYNSKRGPSLYERLSFVGDHNRY